MPKRRANGEGNIRKRKDGRWEGRYTVGHDPETGKAIIKNVLGKTQAEAKKKPKGLAPKTVRNIHQMIGSAYNLAMEQKLVTRNPTQGCALPKVEHKEMKTLTADQLSAFFQEARDSGVYELYYLDLATGLRRGGTAGIEVDGCGLPARGTENSESHLSAEWQSSRSPAENKKCLPHAAPVGRCDKRSENAKM